MAKLAKNNEQAFGLALVQRRVGLVQNQQSRFFQEHAGEFHELLLADAQPADRRIDIHMQTELRKKLAARLLHGVNGDQSSAQRLAIHKQVGEHRALRKQ